jgi:hypothetical protein
MYYVIKYTGYLEGRLTALSRTKPHKMTLLSQYIMKKIINKRPLVLGSNLWRGQ